MIYELPGIYLVDEPWIGDTFYEARTFAFPLVSSNHRWLYSSKIYSSFSQGRKKHG